MTLDRATSFAYYSTPSNGPSGNLVREFRVHGKIIPRSRLLTNTLENCRSVKYVHTHEAFDRHKLSRESIIFSNHTSETYLAQNRMMCF